MITPCQTPKPFDYVVPKDRGDMHGKASVSQSHSTRLAGSGHD